MELWLERGRELWQGLSSLPELVSPPRCSQTVPTALCPRCFQLSQATDLLPPPLRSLCLFSLCRDPEQAGPKSLSQGKGADSLKRHREGFECSQALREALLAAKRAHS